MRKKDKLILIILGVLIIAIIGVVIVGSMKDTKEPTGQVEGPQPNEQSSHGNTQYIKISTVSWADRAWLSKVDKSTITKINFVRTYTQSNARQAWVFDGINCYDCDGVIYIVVNNGLQITGSMNGAFSDLTSLTEINGLELVDTSEVTDMSNLLKNCSSLQSFDAKNLETDGVVLAEGMFQGCSALEDLDMSDNNLENAIDMDSIYAQCSSLNTLHLPKTESVMSLSRAFENVGASADFKTDIFGNINTKKCTDMSYMFSDTSIIDYSFVQDFNTDNLKTTEGMFYSCCLESIDLTKWNVSKLENTKDMFWRNMSLRSCVMDGWDVSSLDNCEGMFYKCTSMKNISLNWVNVPAVIKSSAGLFKNCAHLLTADVSCLDDVHFGDAREMFANCERMTDIYANGFTADVSDDMFIHCIQLSGAIAYTEDLVDVNMANTQGYFKDK